MGNEKEIMIYLRWASLLKSNGTDLFITANMRLGKRSIFSHVVALFDDFILLLSQWTFPVSKTLYRKIICDENFSKFAYERVHLIPHSKCYIDE